MEGVRHRENGVDMKTLSIYSITVGIGIFLAWTTLLISGQASALYKGTGYLALHVVGEYMTAIMLFVSGFFSMKRKKPFEALNFIAVGMLLVLALHAMNGYLYQSDFVMFAFFAIVFAATIVFALASILGWKKRT
jgi:hypothetical protein